MSASPPPASQPGEPVIVAVHGLPTEGQEPRLQLEPIRQALRVPPARWLNYEWAGSTRLAIGRPMLRIRNREFGSFYAQHFGEWLQARLQEIPAHTPLALISYSAGALIVYKWLATRASAADVQRIAVVFCLAGPYRFRQPQQVLFLEDRPDYPITVREDPVSLVELGRHLRPWQVVVLLAEKDGTIPRWNASLRSLPSACPIDHHIIEGATHLTLPAHQHVHEYLRVRLPQYRALSPGTK